jgi:polar amino acid transport system substrate-binding protein
MRGQLTAAVVVVLGLLASVACGGSTSPTANTSCNPTLTHPALVKVGTIVMATNATLPPMQYIDANGNVIGMRIELGNDIAAKLCLKPEWVNVTFDAMIPGVQSGRWDMINTGMFYTVARAQVVKLVPYEVQGVAISVAKGNPKNIHTTDDLSGKVIAVEAPGYEYDTLTGINTQLKSSGKAPMDIRTFNTTAEAYQALQAGQVQGVAIVGAVVTYYSQQGQFSTAISNMNPAPLAFGFDNIAVANAVADALTQLKNDGTLDALFKKYSATLYAGPYKVQTGPLSG